MEYNNKFENVLPILENNTAQMIFVDFPFNTTKARWDTPVNLGLFWKEAWRILKPNGIVVAKAQIPFNITLGSSQLKHLKYQWIWEKTQATGGMNSKKMPMKAHEMLMIFYKKLPKYFPQKTFGHERKVSLAKNRMECIKRRNEKEDYIYGKEYEEKVNDYDSTERFPRDVLVFASDKQKLAIHPTQTPEALVEYFIKTYTEENDLILDPCRGGNTTGVVCDRLNREYIGIEKDFDFYNIGLFRRQYPHLKTKQFFEEYENYRTNSARNMATNCTKNTEK